MNETRRIERALARLAAPSAELAPERDGASYAVFPTSDRRRRPSVRLSAAQVRSLEAEGAIAALPDRGVFVLSEAGRARVRRDAAEEGEAFLAQHAPIEARTVMDSDGGVRKARGYDPAGPLKRLSALRDGTGRPWLSAEEMGAAHKLRSDWEASQAGLVRGSDWSAAPRSSTARSANSVDALMAARCDARRRTLQALDALAAPLRRVVERVCLSEEGLEAMERSEGWPARSGKIALKLGLAQLALLSR